MTDLVFNGLDGANPLGFLATIGTLIISGDFCKEPKLGWRKHESAWRPFLSGYKGGKADFCKSLAQSLASTSEEPFEIDKKLPFSVEVFRGALKKIRHRSTVDSRRDIDLLAAFGSEVCVEKENFQDTFFRMVRSGDSAGQGFPFYAKSIRSSTGEAELFRTLFDVWDYRDKGFSLRWDPLEDQRYALRWHDPSKNKDKSAPNTMNGANALAIEALVLFPAMRVKNSLSTTGFSRNSRKRVVFSWPIWDGAISLDVIRSLVSLDLIHNSQVPRKELNARGVLEVYRCERIAPNQYYRNFSPAIPV